VGDPIGWIVHPFSLSSLLVRSAGTPVGLIAHYSDTPPFSLASVDVQPTQITVTGSKPLNPSARLANLTECPDGTIYGTFMSRELDTQLVRVNVDRPAVEIVVGLSVGGRSLRNDLWDLACSPSGILYGLADPDYDRINQLFRIDLSTGNMTAVATFDVVKMTFAR
jgi:hypothetical protein